MFQFGRFADPDLERRRRLVAVAKARLAPDLLTPSSSGRARAERMRLVERMRRQWLCADQAAGDSAHGSLRGSQTVEPVSFVRWR